MVCVCVVACCSVYVCVGVCKHVCDVCVQVLKTFDARALGRDRRVYRGGRWANFSENCSTLLHIVSYLQPKSFPFAALAFTDDPHSAHLQDRHVRVRRNFAEELLARLALAPGRRISRKISSSRRLNLDVSCFSDEKLFRVNVVAPAHGVHTFPKGKIGPT